MTPPHLLIKTYSLIETSTDSLNRLILMLDLILEGHT